MIPGLEESSQLYKIWKRSFISQKQGSIVVIGTASLRMYGWNSLQGAMRISRVAGVTHSHKIPSVCKRKSSSHSLYDSLLSRRHVGLGIHNKMRGMRVFLH